MTADSPQPPDPSMPDPDDMGCGVRWLWGTPLGDWAYPFCAAHDKAYVARAAGLNPNKTSWADDKALLAGMLSAAGWNPLRVERSFLYFGLAAVYGIWGWPKPNGGA